LPNISQTLILTRYATKTAMPEGERLGDLARIVEELLPHYGADCPMPIECSTILLPCSMRFLRYLNECGRAHDVSNAYP
jgi:precorrin-4 methylase